MQKLGIHELYMQRCLELGARGISKTAPNPMVGSVVVWNNKIIGEGYHMRYGEAHAEVNAINSVKDKTRLRESTLYVNLEPCAHQGKTPPCSDLIIKSNIPRVVIGTVDLNSLVAGKGIQKLKSAGIEVISNILEKECLKLNRRFFTFHKYNRPYVILKWAESADGFLDIQRKKNESIGPNWISNSLSRKLVHKWRSQEQAILVGTNTVLADNPKLDTRLWPGPSPIKLIIDRNLRIPPNMNIFKEGSEVIIFNSKINKVEGHVRYVRIDFASDTLNEIMQFLHSRDILSIIVEGGSKVLNSHFDKNLWDEAYVFKGSKNFFSGISAPKLNLLPEESVNIIGDSLNFYKNFTHS